MNTLMINRQNPEDEWIEYILNESTKLASSSESSIESYMNDEAGNPEMQEFLNEESTIAFIRDEPELQGMLPMSLSMIKTIRLKPDWINFRLKRLKNKIKKIFCSVVSELRDLDSKKILSAALVAIIPAFGSGLPAALLPLIIGILAILLIKGIDAICPA